MSLPVTALYAGLMGLWLLALGFEVMRRRRRHDVSTGDGGYFLTGARRLNLRILGMMLTVGMIGAVALGLMLHALARLG